MWETQVWSLGREDLLEKEKEMATHSSTLAWKIPWREKPGRLQSMGSQRVGQDWATSLSLSIRIYVKHKKTVYFLFLSLSKILWKISGYSFDLHTIVSVIDNSCGNSHWKYNKNCPWILSVWSYHNHYSLSKFQFSSVAQSFLTFWDPMDCSMPGFHCSSCPSSCPSPTLRACSNSCPWSRWFYF